MPDLATDLAGSAGSGAGGSGAALGVGIWMPDAPPLVPHAQDDEFPGPTIDPKWTEYDHSGACTPSIDTVKRMLRLDVIGHGQPPANNFARLNAMTQPIPDTEYALYTKLGAQSAGVQDPNPGIVLLQNATTTGDARMLYSGFFRTAAGVGAAWQQLTAYNAVVPAGTLAVTGNIPMPRYLRVRVNGTTYFADISADGLSWFQGLTGAIGFTPTLWGLGTTPTETTATVALFDFARVFSGAGSSVFGANQIGRYV